MKRVGYLMDKIVDMDNLCLAYHKACRGKQGKSEVVAFSKKAIENLQVLRDLLISGNPSIGNYHYFTIYDPKQRIICAANFQERVLHHAIMNVCHPYFERNLIDHTYATRPQKGVYSAVEYARSALRRYSCVAKLDVRKYFDSVSHDVLKSALRRLFKDEKLLSIFDKIIDSYSVTEGKGLPIGNLTSQYFANYYLSSLDHYLKESVKVPAYVRYMDDMLLFASDKVLLKKQVTSAESYLREKLFLTLKPPVLYRSEQGVPFLGYALYPHKLLLSGRSKKRFRQKMFLYNDYLAENLWSESQYQDHVVPLLAFVQKAYSKDFRIKTRMDAENEDFIQRKNIG